MKVGDLVQYWTLSNKKYGVIIGDFFIDTVSGYYYRVAWFHGGEGWYAEDRLVKTKIVEKNS